MPRAKKKLRKTASKRAEWISQSEAARVRGVSRQAISELVKRGRLKRQIIGGKARVNRSDLENFQMLPPWERANSRWKM